MFRFLFICICLIFGITAKPHLPWNELTDGAVQETVVSIDEEGKVSWGVEVEPLEDMDGTLYDIDPRMKIWKSMTRGGLDKQPLKAIEDMDELYHPSVADLLKVQIPNVPAADIQTEASQKDMTYNQEPEEDRDDIDRSVFSNVAWEETEQDLDEKQREQLIGYLAPLMAEYKARSQLSVAHFEPDEENQHHREDELRHQDKQPPQTQPREHEVPIHRQPEEDMDALYHKDLPELVLYQLDAEAEAPLYFPSQRRHSEPEEDLDGIYHQ